MNEVTHPLLIIISGPSGVGKDAILIRMKEKALPFFYSVTATSREKRPGEIDGIDYHFIEKTEFETMIADGEFLEWANVYGNLYGVPKKTIKEAIAEGKDAIVKVDVQGAMTIKRLEPQAVSIFITPPSMQELERRLIERKTESGTNLERRLKTAREEMQSQYSFDHIVISKRNGIDEAISEIENIIQNERIHPKQYDTAYKLKNKQIETSINRKAEKLAPERAGDKTVRVPLKRRRRIRLSRIIRRMFSMFEREE